MSSATYSRDDVQTHSDGYSAARPAVNVKIYDSLEDGWRKLQTDADDFDPGFTLDWIRAHISEDRLGELFNLICEWDVEMIESDAQEIFGAHVTVEQFGRSGGWVSLDGLPDLADWDAVTLAKWRKFARYARNTADWVMPHLIETIYLNEYELWRKRGRPLHRATSMIGKAA